MWDREKTERAERPQPLKPQNYTPPPRRVYHLRAGASWAVCKAFDDGEKPPIVIKAMLTVEQAEQAAYRMIDAMSDDEVGRALDEGWTYRAVRIKGAGARKVANPDDKTVTFVKGVPVRRP